MALRVGDQTIDELTVTDSRIEPGIRKIDNEIDQDEHSHNEYDESLDSVVVPIQYRIYKKAAESIKIEDLLSDHQSANKERKFHADDGHYRQKSIPQRMPVDHKVFFKTFSPTGPNIVLMQDVEKSRSGHPSDYSRIAITGSQYRPDQLGHVFRKIVQR